MPTETPDFFPAEQETPDFIPETARPDMAKNPPSVTTGAPGRIPVTEQSEPNGIVDRLANGPGDAPPMGGRIPESIKNAPDSLGDAVGGMAIGGAGLMGGAALSPLAKPIAKAGVNFVKNHPIASTLGLEAAKHIPGIGRFASRIPSWLPLMAGGGKSIPEAAEGEEAAETMSPGGIPDTTPSVKGRLVLSPEEATAQEHMQRLAKTRASQRGMQYAGGMTPKD